MAEQRSTIEFRVDGLSIAALTAGTATDAQAGTRAGTGNGRGKPLIAALHGGTYTARYFDVAGSPQGTFMDLAAAAGYPVVCFDRPGYGGSAALPPRGEHLRPARAACSRTRSRRPRRDSRPTACS